MSLRGGTWAGCAGASPATTWTFTRKGNTSRCPERMATSNDGWIEMVWNVIAGGGGHPPDSVRTEQKPGGGPVVANRGSQ